MPSAPKIPRFVYHVSDQDDLTRFAPRPVVAGHSTGVSGAAVWAVDDDHLHAYLLPRDCPRLACYAKPDSDPADVARIMGPSGARYLVVIEARWLAAAQHTPLTIYTFDGRPFRCVDAGAGYWTSDQPVTPTRHETLANPLQEMLSRDVELRIVDSLWPLRDAILASTLQFSFIRMRNARPRR